MPASIAQILPKDRAAFDGNLSSCAERRLRFQFARDLRDVPTLKARTRKFVLRRHPAAVKVW
jgi:hypothetical protein